MSIIESAKIELAAINFGEEDSGVMIEILEKFFSQWDSGGAVAFAAPVLMRLLKGQPLAPLTGADSEWLEVGPKVFQNIRCSTVFKQDEPAGRGDAAACIHMTSTMRIGTGISHTIQRRNCLGCRFTKLALKTRILPVLLWDSRGLCKPISFQRPGRFVGSLMSAALLYENRTCDELILLDIDATEKRRAPRFKELEQFTSKLFCPITFGGGIACIDHIRDALNSGADKVVIRSHATPAFIRDASTRFGSQCIVVAIDYHACNPFGELKRPMIAELAKQIEDDGAGEIILTCIDRDGTRSGYDLATLHEVCSSITIPVIANGGCSGPKDMLDAVKLGAHAVAASSMFLFSDITPAQCKEYLSSHGVPVRIET